MFGRGWLFLMLLAGTVAVPYVASNSSDLRESVAKFAPSLSGEAGDAAAETATASTPPARAPTTDAATASPVSTPAGAATTTTPPQRDLTDVAEMAEVFRLDVTPVWVINRWTRVSTQLAGLGEHGYRVPLVTGSREDDLAGALTYYFTAEHRLKRITFSGTTGDPRRLVGLLNNQFNFERTITPDAGAFTYESSAASSAPSTLHIRPVRVVRANAPHARFNIELEMNTGT